MHAVAVAIDGAALGYRRRWHREFRQLLRLHFLDKVQDAPGRVLLTQHVVGLADPRFKQVQLAFVQIVPSELSESVSDYLFDSILIDSLFAHSGVILTLSTCGTFSATARTSKSHLC